MTRQVETATIVGTIINPGNATIIVTALGLTGSPKTFSVAVLAADVAATVAQKSRWVLGVDADIQAFFTVSGTGANIVLTARVDAPNDATMNISSDNGSCTGLTTEATSVHTLAGAASITNGYAAHDEFLSYMSPTDLSADTNDDPVVDMLIESSSRLIDDITRRTFYARTETHLYDAPIMRGFSPVSMQSIYTNIMFSRYAGIMMFDDDLLAITTLTNGDGSTIPSTGYVLYPANQVPKYGLQLKDTSGLSWLPDGTGSFMQCIPLLGTWGYSSTTPSDIHYACLDISVSVYKKRFGKSANQVATVTAAGIVLTPKDIPDTTARILGRYARAGFA